MSEERLSRIIEDFNYRNLNLFFRSKCENYAEAPEGLPLYDDERFTDFQKLGEIRFDDGDRLVVTSSLVSGDLSERSGKKAQYEKAKKILKEMAVYDAGFFIFHDNTGSFRFSLVYAQFQGTKRSFSSFRRFTYFVSKDQTNKTFRIRVGGCSFISLEAVKDAFSVEKVNKEFYSHIARFFYRLTGYECKREMTLPSVSEDDKETYQEFAVRLIGRSIFCWFLKYKKSANGISLIPESILSSEAVKQHSQYYHSTLEKLFFEVLNTPQEQRRKNILPDADKIPFLNGGLFEPHDDFYDNGKPQYNLIIPDDWFEQFFEILEQYNFTIDENSTVDADVSVDPEMLGRIFENLLAEVNPETGETARKATGSYYTPRTIVDYMVDQSVKQYLLTKTSIDEDRLAALLSYENPDVALNDSEKVSIISALDEIKIIDPACGSGAFPMGILHKMLLVLQKADPDLKLWLKNHLGNIEPGIFKDRLLERIRNENWEYVRKLLIIQKSVYGVDIQTIAVEISKLRFFLSLIVDEQIDDLKNNRGVEALPNLEFKFVAANSLIGLPPVLNRQVGLGIVSEEITRLKELRNRYLRSYGREKKEIEEDFLKTRGKLIEQTINWGGKDALALQLANWDPFSNDKSGWFDPEWMFGISGGFDVVIANPPYLNLTVNSYDVALLKEYNRRFTTLIGAQSKNLFAVFIELGVELLNFTGTIVMIVPEGLTNTKSYTNVRKLFNNEKPLKSLIIFDEFVFESSVIGNVVFVASNRESSEFPIYLMNRDGEITRIKRISYSDIMNSQYYEWKTHESDNNIVEKVCKNGKPLSSFNYSFSKGMVVKDRVNHLRPHKSKITELPFLLGKNIGKYCLYYQYFTTYKELEIVGGTKVLSKHLVVPRILIRRTGDSVCATYSDSPELVESTLYIMTGQDLKYVLSILNSKLLTYYAKQRFITNQQAFPQIVLSNLQELPLAIANKEDKQTLAEIVNQILAITKDEDYRSNPSKQAKVKEYEHQIDQMVYELYDLTPEEIAVVEGFSTE